jgi:hypothetical protein
VLLIITDSVASNIAETKRELSVYCELPFSVIFVGVGRADFTALWDFASLPGFRQTTTVLELRNHQQDHMSLVKTALQNIPGQLVDYMEMNGIIPA